MEQAVRRVAKQADSARHQFPAVVQYGRCNQHRALLGPANVQHDRGFALGPFRRSVGAGDKERQSDICGLIEQRPPDARN